MKPTPLAIHMANLDTQPVLRRPLWLGLELVVLSLTAAGTLGMLLGMALKASFG